MTEEKMLSRLKRGKPEALEALIDQYNAYVSAIVVYVLGSRATAQDVEELVSDVFLAVWNHADALKPGKVKAYLGTTARNTTINFLRKKHALPMDADEVMLASGDDTENEILRRERNRMVREAVLSMKEPDREIFLRYYYYMQTTGDIARQMALPPGTVRVHLMRGRNTLKQKFLQEDVL